MTSAPAAPAHRSWELVHQTIRSDHVEDRVVEIKLPQQAEITYAEVGYAEVNLQVNSAFLQLFVHDGPSSRCLQHRQLTDGQVDIPSDEFSRIDAKRVVTDTFVLSGRFQSFTFRAVGSVVADPDPSQVNSWQALPDGEHDLREEPNISGLGASTTRVQSPDLLPLNSLPEVYQRALAPLADYWEAVGMAVDGNWPDSLDSYLTQDTFGDLLSHAEDMVAVLLQDTVDCDASSAALDRIHDRLSAACAEAPASENAAVLIGQLPLEQFVQVVVVWMGLGSAPASAGRRGLEFARFAHAAALLLCATESTAYCFLREGGLRRCAQVLHDFRHTPAAPLVRCAAATLCMLQSTCGDIAAALISGVHPGPCADSAPLTPPTWTRPAVMPKRFWSRPLPEPPSPPAAPTELGSVPQEPALESVNPNATAVADTGLQTDKAATEPAKPELEEVREGAVCTDVPMRHTLTSESLSENTSSLLGHSESSSVTSGDDGAEGPAASDLRSSLPPDGSELAVASGEQPQVASGSPGTRQASAQIEPMDAIDAGEPRSAQGIHAESEQPAQLDAVAGATEDGDQSGGDTDMQPADTAGGAGSAVVDEELMGSRSDSPSGTALQNADHAAPSGAHATDAVQDSTAADQQGGEHGSGEVADGSGDVADGKSPAPVQAAPEFRTNGAQRDGAGDSMRRPGEGAAKRAREEPAAEPGHEPPSSAKRGRLGNNGMSGGDAQGMSLPDQKADVQHAGVPPLMANGSIAAAADVAMVEAAVEAAGAPLERDPAPQRLLRRGGAAAQLDDRKDMLAQDEEFWAQLQAVEVPDSAALAEVPPLPELLEQALRLPQPRTATALCALALARLQVREALAAFAAHTETLIGEVQQGRIQFRHVDNSIIVVAEALRRLAAVGEALERAGGVRQPWREADARLQQRLPAPRRGDACYVRCVTEHGVLRRCLQVLKLPALIVDSLVENGAELSGAERRSLHRRLKSHFVSPLRDFCCGLLATPQGTALLMQQGAACSEIAAVLAPSDDPSSSDGGGAPVDTSPAALLSETLSHLTHAHHVWSAVAEAPNGSAHAMRAAHTLLAAATGDRSQCKALANALCHLPAACGWVRASVAEATALDLIAHDPSLATNPAAVAQRKLPGALVSKVDAIVTAAQPLPQDALLVLPLLCTLCSRTLQGLMSFWADTLGPLLPLLQAHPACAGDSFLASAGGDTAGESTPVVSAGHSMEMSSTRNPASRSQHACWLAGCALTLQEQRQKGVGVVVGSLNTLLPQLLPGLIRPLPLGLVDWASAEPLCDVAAPAFLRLRTLTAARGRITAALAVIAATTSDPVCSPRAVAAAHERGAMYVLPRAVAAAVTWMHGARAAALRGQVLGESHCPVTAAAEVERALELLHEACRAMCAMTVALLTLDDHRKPAQKSERMHGRWRTVCHVLLAAYHAVHWCPQNIETFTGACAKLSRPLELRHLIAATLQRWIVSESPICPLQQMLRAGARAEDPHSIRDFTDAFASHKVAQQVSGWHRPSALTTALALLGDICPPPWPSNESVHRVRNIDALTFPELRRAVAASCDRVMPDLQALIGAARFSRSAAALAALVRALPRVFCTASFIGNYLLGPLVQDLQEVSAAASPSRPLPAGRAHSLLSVTVAVALHPLGKETLRENGLSIVLNDLLHKMVAAWGRDSASDADKAAYRVLCRLTLDALRFLCDYKVTMEPAKPLEQRLQYDMPPKKHLAQVVCGLLECLPFLEGSTGTAAVDVLRLLVHAPYDPVIVSAIKAGADLAATAFNEEERRAVGGEGQLALAAASSSTLQYLAEELVRRAERLEAHGSRRGVSAACADAAELLRHCAQLPNDHSSKPLEPVAAIDRISITATHALAVHNKHSAARPARAGDIALPLDGASVMDLSGGADHEWFLQLFAQRQLPQEAMGGVEIVRRVRPRAEPLATLLPPALEPPAWAPPAPAAAPRVPLSHAPASGKAHPWPGAAAVTSERKGGAAAAIPGLGTAEGPAASRPSLPAKAQTHVAARSSAADGPFSVPARGFSDSGDFYEDLAADPAPRGSLGSKRRSSMRARMSSDGAAAQRSAASQPTAASPAAPATVNPPRPPVHMPPKPAEPAAIVPSKPPSSKRLPAGLLPAATRAPSARLPAGLLPASMPPKPASHTAAATQPPRAAALSPVRPASTTPAAPPAGGLPPPRDSAPQADLPPPPPVGQVYSRVPAAMPAAPAHKPTQQPKPQLGVQAAKSAAVPGAERTEGGAGPNVPKQPPPAAAPVAPNENQLATLLRDPDSLRRLLSQDTAMGRFLRERLQGKLPKATEPGT